MKVRYFGGKTRVGKKIADFINLNLPLGVPYWEPFVGAGGVLQYVEGEPLFASDICEPLVLMWQALQAGWEPPLTVTEEEYEQAKAGEYDPPLTAFIGFGCSHSGKWFGGFARGRQHEGRRKRERDYAANAHNSLLKKYARNRISEVAFSCRDFFADEPPDNDCFIYCDPPFQGTTKFPGIPEVSSEVFWERCGVLHSDGHVLLVSEYTAPAEWVAVKSIREKNRKRLGQGSDNPQRYEGDTPVESTVDRPTVDVESLYCHRELVSLFSGVEAA